MTKKIRLPFICTIFGKIIQKSISYKTTPMSKKIVILTGSELRHTFFRKSVAAAENIMVLASYCESEKGNLNEIVQSQSDDNSLRAKHLELRNATENVFFEDFCNHTTDFSNPIFIEKGAINDSIVVENIKKLNPDLIVSYGCSIIKSDLLNIFEGRFINLHLGLSPYYRGSGTNFWPFVNNELQFVGVTFMHIDAGIDTGKIIHQIRAEIFEKDDIHQIGNRLIQNMAQVCITLLLNFDNLQNLEPLPFDKMNEKYYRTKDFTEISLQQMYQNFESGMIQNYLNSKVETDLKFPIIKNILSL